MEWNIPGTVLTVPIEDTEYIPEKFTSMFLGGGMVLSQVAAVTGLEPYTIQNWVKRGFLAKPIGKKYTLRQLCRILIINMLKDALPMEKICGLLTYINGHMDDESDDLIDDSQLYFLFLRLAAHHRRMNDPAGRDQYVREVLANYEEPIPGARKRVEKVLNVMLTAWAASLLRQQAVSMAEALEILKGE
jgi:DNA-binding transcriptional MerR regulator